MGEKVWLGNGLSYGSGHLSQTFSPIIPQTCPQPSSFYTHLPAYEDGTECSETSTYKIQTPGNCPKESIKQ